MDPLSAEPAVNDDKEFIYLNSQLPAQLQQLVTDFIKDLKKPKYSKPLNYDELCLIFKEFYIAFEDKSREYVLGSINSMKIEMKEVDQVDDNEELIKKYVEIAEFKLTNSFSDKLIYKSEINNKINEFINKKIEIITIIEDLNYYELLDLDLEVIDLNLIIFDKISNEFLNLNNYKSPSQKLIKLVNIHQELININNELNGDYILPLLIYLILINSNKIDFYLNFKYIQNFKNFKYFKSNELYCLTNFEAALTFIKTIDLKNYKFKDLVKEDELIINEEYAELPKVNFLSSAIEFPKNVLYKFKPDDEYLNLNPLKSLADAIKWTKSTTSPESINRIRSNSNSLNLNFNKFKINKELDLNKFNNKDFESLSILELREMFNDYKILINMAKATESH